MTIKNLFKQYPYWLICFVGIVLVTLYWSVWASDRYLSQSNIVLESPQVTVPNMDVSALLGGNSGGSDMLLLRDYLLSVDMLRKVDSSLEFRKHYANSDVDYFTRLSSTNVPIEELHEYYLEQVSVELDDYAQILRVNVSAFTPQMAHAITSLLLSEGEAHMNRMGQRLANEQVKFLEEQVAGLNQNFQSTRSKLIEYQNKNGLVSPAGNVESLSVLVAGLEAELANLQAQQTMLTSYQSKRSPSVVKIGNEIKAVRQQIAKERSRMAQQSGGALNTLSAEYQTLELKVKFAMESYSGALAALESTRIEAARKLKQVSILQSPTLPEYPVEPRRVYNIVVFTVIALFLTLITHMFVLIIKDHRD